MPWYPTISPLPTALRTKSAMSFVAIPSIFADITNYKSHFTWNHSQGIAEKAEAMRQFYGYDKGTWDMLKGIRGIEDITRWAA